MNVLILCVLFISILLVGILRSRFMLVKDVLGILDNCSIGWNLRDLWIMGKKLRVIHL